MNKFNQIACIAVALSAMAAAQAPAPPALPATPATPSATPAPAVPARPARPARPPKAPVAPKIAASSYLGVDIREVNHDRMAALKLKEPRGVEITMVDRDAPAGKAGLKEHDVILSFNGRNIQSSEELRKLIRETPPEQAVELGISRDGQAMTVKTQLADRRKIVVAPHIERNIQVRIPRIEIPSIAVYARRNGIAVENLTPQLGEVFGVKNGEGVLVRSVEKDSPGESAGLHAGDVIVRVGSETVTDASDWNRLMRGQKPGAVQLGIIRDKRQQTISLNVPERNREQSFTFSNMEDFDTESFKQEMMELHRLQPEIERSVREAQERAQRELERSQREMQREMERRQREMERLQREHERSQREQERAQREQERAQREQERAQRDAERAREQAQREAERAREQAEEQAERAREQAEQQAERAREQAEQQAERAREEAERNREKAQRDQQPPPPSAPPAQPEKPPTPPQ